MTTVDPVEQLCAEYADPKTGVLLTRQLGKAVLSKGAWATVMFLIQDWDAALGQFRAPKVSVRRYKRAGAAYRFHSAFNLTGHKQAAQMVEVMQTWFGPNGPGATAGLDVSGEVEE